MEEVSQTQFIKRFNWITAPWIRNSLGLWALAMLCIFFWVTFNVIEKYRATLSLSQQQTALKTREIANAIDASLAKLVFTVNELATDLRGEPLNEERVESILKRSALNHDDFYALGVAFKPYQLNAHLRLFSPFVRMRDSAYIMDRIDNYYDYINGVAEDGDSGINEDWFARASAGKSDWLAPFYDPAYQQHTLKYVVPLERSGKSTANEGVVFVDIDLEWIRNLVESHDVGDNGYAIILNEYNQSLYHGLKGPQEIVDHLNERMPASYIAGFKSGKLGKNDLTGRPAWLHSYPIGDTGWYVLTVMNVDPDTKQLFGNHQKKRLIHKSDLIGWIVAAVILCLSVYAWLAVILRQLSVMHLWRHSFIASFVFSLGIIAIWICQHYAPPPMPNNSLVLSNRAIVDRFQNEYAVTSLNEHKKPPLYIPTGLFIQSIEFLNATNVALTGYLWQRYPRDYEGAVERSVIFPEAIQSSMRESYEREEDSEIVKGWYFEVTLRELFDYSIFPFDRQSVWVRLWHKNFTENVILVPDFKSYDSLNPSALPGIERDFVLSGWSLSKTFYDMRINTYNTNFGDVDFKSRDKMPELYFNIELSRNFLNPFIAHLFPLTVVLLMLFAIMVTISRNEKRKELSGFNVSTIVASCSALFFVVLIAHVQLRGELSTDSIIYLEYFYLLSYVLLLMITVNAILFSSDLPISFLKFQDNIFPKLIYWPLLQGGLFAFTAILFW